MKQGYLQIYTGNGKGKTTAAMGLALRAAGAGLQVYIGQFVKDMKYSEVRLMEQVLPQITIELLGKGCFIDRPPEEGDRQAAQEGLDHVAQLMKSGQYDVMILDEISIAIVCGLIPEENVLALIERRPQEMELVLTGRYMPSSLMEKADLITEMQEVRHYYTEQGVLARDGIER
ncbi:cob(I)yrinic acid a,c-diamide adenosyltransferase [Intestinimonas butyriciproducens]|uniref:cob(I)yrinic acid a,c-diamide adenosyltransferase n=1 Tax=Intestinimonas butyriciproducens TaxID=1297617 RepID=UPI00195ED5C3|nr:cob(I)yrinic acid a,c-diamide adenosyltransferase [Intestinimonas butyriciproducens]MBM6918750.1 cob(I)yrinic acid a,c-diamide adenosyltransferase [Intestinimonas butyriciproducens]